MSLYNKLFIAKELRTIFGKHGGNFWILFFVFLLTIFAFSFSRSGLNYLDYKMNDPFIHWIEIREQGGHFPDYNKAIEEHKKQFGISGAEENHYIFQYVFNRKFEKIRVEGRTISYDSKLLYNILDKDSTGLNALSLAEDKKNVIIARETPLYSNDYGWIVTKDLMSRIGYDDPNSYPLFVNYPYPGVDSILMRLGIANYKNYFAVPIPIVAVVNQLPDLLDFIAPSFFMQQKESSTKPFNITMHDTYFSDVLFAMENPTEEKEKAICSALDVAGVNYDAVWETNVYTSSIREATTYRIIVRDTTAIALNSAVEQICKDSTISRIFDYDFGEGMILDANYTSLMFTDLSKVPEFVQWSKEEHGIRIDMTQIEAKDNFHLFNILAWSLCIAIAFIAIAFIAIFLYFLIDSHFRSISKNLGTIMAFGLSNKSIIRIYLAVFLGLILSSLLAVVVLLGGAEFLCSLLSVAREGGLPYFSLCDLTVIAVIGVLPVVSAVVIVISLRRKLRATPGDLIFERN